MGVRGLDAVLKQLANRELKYQASLPYVSEHIMWIQQTRVHASVGPPQLRSVVTTCGGMTKLAETQQTRPYSRIE